MKHYLTLRGLGRLKDRVFTVNYLRRLPLGARVSRFRACPKWVVKMLLQL